MSCRTLRSLPEGKNWGKAPGLGKKKEDDGDSKGQEMCDANRVRINEQMKRGKNSGRRQ